MVQYRLISCLGGPHFQLFTHWGYQSFLRGIEATPTQHKKNLLQSKVKGATVGATATFAAAID